MPTTTSQRRTQTAYRGEEFYGYGGQARYQSVQRAYDIPVSYPQRQVYTRPQVVIRPQAVPQKKAAPQVKPQSKLKVFGIIAVVVFLAVTMLCRYAAILESSARVDELKGQISDLEAACQALSTKIDQQLEIGALEAYATGQLGMIRPDNSQVFYVDLQMQDETKTEGQGEEDKASALQGTPGALVRAIQVLK